jgi:hypothetical protein
MDHVGRPPEAMTQQDLSDEQRDLCPFCYHSVAVREGRFVEHSLALIQTA